jgi:glycosyltransferase involved in cell wall biosynthesis
VRRLSILSVGYALAPVGPDAVGGAEQVLTALDRALVGLGHRSYVVAPAGSRVAGELIATPPVPAGIDEAARTDAERAMRRAVMQTLRRRPVDLIHCHGLDFANTLPQAGPPALVTLHLPPGWYPPGALQPTRPNTWLNPVSAAQAADCPPGPALLDPVPNGVPVEALGRARHARRSFTLMLGRICPEKGQHIALDAVRRANVPLLIVGHAFPYPEHLAYVRDEIEPLLDRWRRRIEPVGFARKRRLLAAARCVLVPSLAPETGSLVAMEAMACGTPVIAYPAGALAEIVEHGRTGFLVRSPEEMAAAIAAAGTIDPETCRRTARERFPLARTVESYLGLYRRLAQAQTAPS